MKILVTGTAGFIGYHLVKRLCEENVEIIGIDNINTYYDVSLKHGRLLDTGIDPKQIEYNRKINSSIYKNYAFLQIDLVDKEAIEALLEQEHFTHIINLGGQAGVRYSLEAPHSYIQANIVGYMNLLEACRIYNVKHFIYASSSSVYGMNSKVPFSEEDRTDAPVSLYAATKKCDEIIAYPYSKMGIETIGLRFFTVYGPWGRPDMAPFKFLKAILNDETIQVYNHGNMLRDFTYVGDIIEGINKIVFQTTGNLSYKIYNIGCSNPVNLMDFIHVIEDVSGKKAKLEFVEMQPGDVVRTYADITRMHGDFGYTPSIQLQEGIKRFYDWYINFYG